MFIVKCRKAGNPRFSAFLFFSFIPCYIEEDGEVFEEKMKQLTSELSRQMEEEKKLDEEIKRQLEKIGFKIF
ncbi:MAG: hypothetical protein ACYCSB_05310 [bacterium]